MKIILIGSIVEIIEHLDTYSEMLLNNLGIWGVVLSCLLITVESIIPVLPLCVFVTFNFFGYNSNNAVYPITKRKNKISTGRKPSKRIFVEMNVVPHMMIVNTAAKCPIILLLSAMSASFAYAGKNSVIRTGTDSDKLVKIMREMALVKKSGLTSDICGRYSFFQ